MPGGVGRNIAEAATYLLPAHDNCGDTASISSSTYGDSRHDKSGVLLITVLGTDPAGDMLAAHCKSLG